MVNYAKLMAKVGSKSSNSKAYFNAAKLKKKDIQEVTTANEKAHKERKEKERLE